MRILTLAATLFAATFLTAQAPVPAAQDDAPEADDKPVRLEAPGDALGFAFSAAWPDYAHDLFGQDRCALSLIDWAHRFHEAGLDETADQLILAGFSTLSENRCVALRVYEDWLHAFPAFTPLVNNAAWTRYCLGDAEGALKLLLAHKFRGDASFLDTLALVQLATGNKTEALQSALAALEHAWREKTPVFYAHAGDVFCANDLLEEADRAWARAESRAKRMTEDDLILSDYDATAIRQKRRAVRALLKRRADDAS